jgi:hypothetical protein
VEFVHVDVLNDAGGLDRLLRLGVRSVPVVAKGERFVFAQSLDEVARFLRLGKTGHVPLPPEELIQKWITVLRASQRYVRQIPQERITDRVIENRDRSVRVFSHHVFRIGEAFLESVVDSVEYGIGFANIPPEDGTYATGADIAEYGDRVIARLQEWWWSLTDRSCQRQVRTYYGMQSVWELLERSTWHTAQHARQIAHVLERYGIEPDGCLTPTDLAGLPVPERLFE